MEKNKTGTDFCDFHDFSLMHLIPDEAKFVSSLVKTMKTKPERWKKRKTLKKKS